MDRGSQHSLKDSREIHYTKGPSHRKVYQTMRSMVMNGFREKLKALWGTFTWRFRGKPIQMVAYVIPTVCRRRSYSYFLILAVLINLSNNFSVQILPSHFCEECNCLSKLYSEEVLSVTFQMMPPSGKCTTLFGKSSMRTGYKSSTPRLLLAGKSWII